MEFAALMVGKLRAKAPERKAPPEPAPVPLELQEALSGQDRVDWSRAFGHLTVLGPAAVQFLNVKSSGVYVDATLGGGGHSRLILEQLGAGGRLIGLDQDREPRQWAAEGWGRSEGRLTVAAGNFGELPVILKALGLETVDGILLDLGLSSRQLSVPNRGFSWTVDEPLDMRLNQETELTAFEVVNRYSEKELADLIYYYGEERGSRRVARYIAEARRKAPLETTDQLAALVAKALYRPGPPPRIHPATRVFMALRIAVNRELTVLENILNAAPGLLNSGGRMVVISFHSLEDRLVKEAFRGGDSQKISSWQILTKKPLVAEAEEVAANPRARSAKLRAAEKVDPGVTENYGEKKRLRMNRSQL